MTELERKAALALRPYMSKDPVIVDVGSNKGDWTAILGPGAGEVHLFEPNIVLLHYSMVRFDDAENFYFNNLAVFSESKELDFFYFTNSNNGLSSVYRNQKWVDMGLPMETGKVQAITLDDYFIDSDCKIDFLKIDVEGADFEVLKGADNLLNTQSVKFIQVEHSDHIKLSGSSWDQLVAYMESKGYFCYDFTGTEFVRAFEPYTQENYYFIISFTQDWNGEFKKNTEFLRGKVKFALEIGAFEGMTSCYICDNLLSDGRLICVDPLPDDISELPFGDDNKMFDGQYERFIRNTVGKPIELIRKKSIDAYAQLKDYRFDFIYIDGDHSHDAVLADAFNCWALLKWKGYMLFDDYGWRDETKTAIDKFLRKNEEHMQIIVKEYQVLIQKIANV